MAYVDNSNTTSVGIAPRYVSIRGRNYTPGTPAYYEALAQGNQATAYEAGEAAGASVNGLRSQVPDLFPTGGSSSSGSGTSAGSTIPRAVFGTGASLPGAGGGVPSAGGTMLPRPTLADTGSADEAAFLRAKDLTGQTTRASLTGLRSALASRGQLGGGGEFRGTSRIIQGGAQNLADTAREQAIQASQRAAERAATQFQGDISLRGQDLSAQQAADALAARLAEVAYQGEITQRGQDLAAQANQASWQFQSQQQQQLILDRILQQLTPLY